jgi:hypothetical protein
MHQKYPQKSKNMLEFMLFFKKEHNYAPNGNTVFKDNFVFVKHFLKIQL